MKAIVKYRVLLIGGTEIEELTVTHNVPDFESGEEYFLGRKFLVTIEKQIDSYIEELDKTNMMADCDIYLIIDWDIISYSTQDKCVALQQKALLDEDMVELFINLPKMSQLKNDFEAVYTKMRDSLDGLDYERRIKVVFAAMGVAYSSANTILTDLKQSRERFKQAANEAYSRPNERLSDGTWSQDKENIRKSADNLRNIDQNLLENQ